jgi:transposase
MAQFPERTWAGIDVSKKHWDVAIADGKRVDRFDANASGGLKLAALLKQAHVTHVCLEATGHYERPLVEVLREQQMPLSIVNPRQVRNFARAGGQLAKTDQIDARVIARFGTLLQPALTEKKSENQEKLSSLRARRRQVVATRIQEKNRLDTQPDADARRLIEAAVEFYKEQLKSVDEQIRQLVKSDAELQRRADLMVSMISIGNTTATALLAEIPELGTLSSRQAARLAGLAPINRDSGMYRGKRMIGGGRAGVRKALYMPTLVAIKHNPPIKAFYEQLLARGKAKMTAITACMRKLLLILNAMLKENKPWNPTHST